MRRIKRAIPWPGVEKMAKLRQLIGCCFFASVKSSCVANFGVFAPEELVSVMWVFMSVVLYWNCLRLVLK